MRGVFAADSALTAGHPVALEMFGLERIGRIDISTVCHTLRSQALKSFRRWNQPQHVMIHVPLTALGWYHVCNRLKLCNCSRMLEGGFRITHDQPRHFDESKNKPAIP